MNIDTVSSATSTQYASLNSHGRHNVAAHGNDIAGRNKPADYTYDFTSMSRREFDSLWREGGIDTRIPPLTLPAEGVDLTKDTKAQLEAAYDTKINFVEHFQKMIEFQKTLPANPTNENALAYYEKNLSSILSLQGNVRARSVDTQV